MNTEESVKKQLEETASRLKSTNLGAVSAPASSVNTESDYSMVKKEDEENLNKWISIKSKMVLLDKALPREQVRIAKEIALDMATNFKALNNLFSNYPKIQAEYDIYEKTVNRLSSIMNANVSVLQESAIEYFKYLYPNTDPSKDFAFSNKREGDQVGQILKIKYIDEKKQNREVSYFIKTHQHGSNSRDSGVSAGNVDLKELFVYRALEKMGLGPKAHFFSTPFSTQNGFYIATRGFPFSKSVEKQKGKLFYIYGQFEQAKKLVEIKDLASVDKGVIHGLTMIDIISRVFKLGDVATNAGNFGFAYSGDKIKCKIVDFRVGTWGDYKYIDGLLQGFIKGNGTYNYLGFVGTALRDRKPEDKIAEAKQVIADLMENAKVNFYTAIEQAYREILDYAYKNARIWGKQEILGQALEDLKAYYEAVNENFKKFADEIRLATTATLTLTKS